MNFKMIILISLFITNIFATNFNETKLSKQDIETLKEIKKDMLTWEPLLLTKTPALLFLLIYQ